MAWLGFLLFLVWMVGFPYWMIGLRKAPSRLRDWADRLGLQVVDRREPWLTWRGPFPERTNLQTLYRVIVDDKRGQRRTAWILCGSPLRGSWDDRVEVRWDPTDWRPLPAAPRFETWTGRRPVETMGFRLLFLGPCLGLCIMGILLISTGLILSVVAVPLLAISASLGAIVGGLFGVVGDAIRARTNPRSKPRAVISEI